MSMSTPMSAPISISPNSTPVQLNQSHLQPGQQVLPTPSVLRSRSVSSASTSYSVSEDNYDEYIYRGLVLKNRYYLINKIGHGSNAAVWLIYDLVEYKPYAMKIQNSEHDVDGKKEVKMLKAIKKYYDSTDTTDNINCVIMLDYFIYKKNETSNCRFICCQFKLYAGNLKNLLNQNNFRYGMPINIVKNICRQILNGINILHNKLGIIHTDLKLENILYEGISTKQSILLKKIADIKFAEKLESIKKDYGISFVDGKTNKVCTFIQNENDDDKYEKFIDEFEKLCAYVADAIAGLSIEFNSDESTETDYASANLSATTHTNSEDLTQDVTTTGTEQYIDGSITGNSGINKLNFSSSDVVLNKRRQSVDDLKSFLKFRELIDLDAIYNDYLSCIDDEVTDFNNCRENIDIQTPIDSNIFISITDFGNSYFNNKRLDEEIQDRTYRATEVILNLKYGYPCDIWSFGLITFALLTGFNMINFYTDDFNPLNKDIYHLYQLEKFLGKIPKRMIKKSNRKRFLFFKKDYGIRGVDTIEPLYIENRLIKQFSFGKNDAKSISKFLSCSLDHNPKRRHNVTMLLANDWLQQ
jgi:serine/threonine-protein kinase SRPK3